MSYKFYTFNVMNTKTFYDSVRVTLFNGKITSSQFEGIEAVFAGYAVSDVHNLHALAYIFATDYHEVGKTMQPIREYDRGGNRDYAKKLKYGGGPGKRVPYATPNHIYYGRGITQTTWYENYQALTAAAKKQGKNWDFLNNPDLLLQMEPSVWAMFHAMKTGLYTGKKLSDYFTPAGMPSALKNTPTQYYYSARRIINGTDAAQKIAEYAVLFYGALTINQS